MKELGNLYYVGNGVTKDYAEAKRWYEKAAAAGNSTAMSNLGNLYDAGNGVSTRAVVAFESSEPRRSIPPRPPVV